MKVETQLVGALSEAVDQARALADVGFDGVFTFEGPHDVFHPLVLAAQVPGLDLMTNVAIALPRNPIHLAHQSYDLQMLSQGRFRLGLGSQVQAHIERRFGVEWSEPVERMRELVLAVKAIHACWQDGGVLRFEGRFYRHTLMTPMFNPGPNPFGPPPVLLGALGPRMTRMAAEVADGLLVMPFGTKRFFHEHTLPAVAKGLAAAGRTPGDLEIVPQVIVCAGRTDQEMAVADSGTRALLGFYGSTPAYRPVLDAEGWGDLQPELNTLTKQGRWDEMAALIDDDVLTTIAVRGTPAQVAAQIVDRFGDTAERVGFYLPYQAPPDLTADVIAELRRASAS